MNDDIEPKGQEQFTEEWDYCRRLPWERPSKVAGKYDWRMNLYQFGLVCEASADSSVSRLHWLWINRSRIFQVLWTIITGHHPPTRPDPQVVDTEFNELGKRRYIWSYGNYIMDDRYDNVDKELRELVVKCMMERPSDRPKMRDIYRLIQRKVNETEWKDEPDEDRWFRDFFTTPAPPRRKPVSRLNDVSCTTRPWAALPCCLKPSANSVL